MTHVADHNSQLDRSVLIIHRLRQTQAIAGVLFFVFLFLHLGNTLLATQGPGAYNSYQQFLQGFYQNPAIELGIVILPLLAHVIAALWLFRLRGKAPQGRSLGQRANSWAGAFLLIVVFGHVLATRGIGLWYDAPPGFAGISFSLWWMPSYFYPYYFLLFMGGLFHSYNGISLLLARTGYPQIRKNRAARSLVMLSGAVAVVVALMAFDGKLFDIHDPRDSPYARAYAEILQIDLGAPAE